MARAKGGGLTDKQHAFVREYLADHNITKAAIRAGYTERSAHTAGYRLMQKGEVKNAIRTAMDDFASKVQVTKQWLLSQAVAIQQEARADKSHAAAVSAAKLAAQLSGNLIERRETRQVQDWSDLTDEELRALAAADYPGEAPAAPSKTKH